MHVCYVCVRVCVCVCVCVDNVNNSINFFIISEMEKDPSFWDYNH